ncbi:AzlC family ABC transporter permease [Polycladidibacter stylochi]|uniref:AzlC family ABC transporter permease n=1 Tax=Polycladidibacter stylochi TaxID=1807766 RepID=UPI0008372DF1|nr:AzlC family ABC transporter permease [Pseudovibrio stylochi]
MIPKTNKKTKRVEGIATEATAGIKAIFPLIFAAIPIGLLYGAVATQKGMSVLEVTLASALVFAGGSQFVALDMWHYPLPIFTIAFATFLVNLRLVLMSFSLGPKAHKMQGLRKYLTFFFLTDETWALSEQRVTQKPLTYSFMLGLALPFYASWTLSSALGASVGALIETPEKWGLDFAFTAMFACLIMGFWKGKSTGITLLVTALTAAAVYKLVPGAWYIIAGALAGIISAAIQYKPEPPKNDKQPLP